MHFMGFLNTPYGLGDSEEPDNPCSPDDAFAYAQRTFGDFEFPEAVAPRDPYHCHPREGYLCGMHAGKTSEIYLVAAVTQRKILLLLDELLDCFSSRPCTVALGSRHDPLAPREFWRCHIDAPVLRSTLGEYEDLLLGDGSIDICVMTPRQQSSRELQFLRDKHFLMYGTTLRSLVPFERVLRSHGISLDPTLKVLEEDQLIRQSTPEHSRRFEELCTDLGAEEWEDD